MVFPRTHLAVVSIASMLYLAPAAAIPFSERVDARVEVERVYQSHRTKSTRPFHQAVPRTVVERKVRTSILQEQALERFWNHSITGDALTRELERIVRGTRYPDRLEEIFQALDHDAPLIYDALVRPGLVDRLSRSFFAWDDSIHQDARAEIESVRRELTRSLAPRALGLRTQEFTVKAPEDPVPAGSVGAIEESPTSFHVDKVIARSEETIDIVRYSVLKSSWDAWWAEVSPSLDGEIPTIGAELPAALPSLPADPAGDQPSSVGGAPCPDGIWDNGVLDDATQARRSHRAVWTGSEMIIVGGGPDDTAARYDPLLDTWTATSPSGQRRFSGHTAVWTGTEVIVWGGHLSNIEFDTGERYDPATDTWTPTSTVSAPDPRKDHTAVWTGTEMIVWGGSDLPSTFNTGGRYDPGTDTWSATSLGLNVPTPRRNHSATWTGTEMMVWGGSESQSLGTGGRYDPATNSWTTTALLNAPTARTRHSAVWTGSEIIIWGGSGGGDVDTGSIYSPAGDSWTVMSTTGAPAGRSNHRAVWADSVMVIWGGWTGGDELDSGGRYDPVGNSWAATSSLNAPTARRDHTAIWTGDRMIAWGGSGPTGNGSVNTGARYDPATDSWTRTSTGSGGPSPRGSTPAVWTGSEMILWGGYWSPDYLGDGSRYDPLLDAWNPTSAAGAPIARSSHLARWTGDEMVVWGGQPSTSSGGRYDPVADFWSATSTVNAPTITGQLVGDWSGSELLVWGLTTQADCDEDSVTAGGRYNPTSDSWTAMSLTGSPPARRAATGLWVGSELIVWGGWRNEESGGECLVAGNEFELDTGFRYNPASDNWSPTSLVGAPVPRGEHGAQSDGARMFIWGGGVFGFTNTGGLYDPSGDQWATVTTVDAPPAAEPAAIIWTGREFGVSTSSGSSGGLYDPEMDAWISIASENAPIATSTAVWTGEMMIAWSSDSGSIGGRYMVDIDHDGECNSSDVCPFDPDPGQSDSDGDGAGDACDNCLHSPNPGQGPVPLGDSILPQDSTTFGWSLLQDVRYVKGDIAGVSVYDVDAEGSLGITNMLSDGSVPTAGHGFYYLVRPDCPVGSWQTTVGDEPLRDGVLP